MLLSYAVYHQPALSYRFGVISRTDSDGHSLVDVADTWHRRPRGQGCKRGGADGRVLPEAGRICIDDAVGFRKGDPATLKLVSSATIIDGDPSRCPLRYLRKVGPCRTFGGDKG